MTEIAGETVVKADVPAQSVDISPVAAHIPSTTTSEQDRKTAGQRRINVIWEVTQASVTILITVAAIFCAIQKIDADVLNFAFVAVISTYYARTNHTKVGGVGGEHEGR